MVSLVCLSKGRPLSKYKRQKRKKNIADISSNRYQYVDLTRYLQCLVKMYPLYKHNYMIPA